MSTMALYRNDIDGVASAAILRYFYPETICIPLWYGAKPPWDKLEGVDTIYILDFDCGADNTFQLTKGDRKIIHIAHVNPIDITWVDNKECFTEIFDPKVSTCVQTWNLLSNNQPIPTILEYISDYDLWTKALPDTMIYYNGLQTTNIKPYPNTDALWNKLLNNDAEQLAILKERGIAITKYIDTTNDLVCKDLVYETEVDGKKFLVCNYRGGNSSIFDKVVDPTKHDYTATWAYIGSSGAYRVSVYAVKPENDAGEFCRNFNGGGKPGVGSYNSSKFPFPRCTNIAQPPVNHYEPLQMLKRSSFITFKYVEKNESTTFFSQSFHSSFEGVGCIAINSPIAGRDIFLNIRDEWVDIGIVYAYTNCGLYRVTVYPLMINLADPNTIRFVELLKSKYQCTSNADGSYTFMCMELPFTEQKR